MINFNDRYVEQVDDISKFQPINNHVLVRVDFEPEKVTSAAGIYLGSSWWDEAGHTARFGQVVKTPKMLLFRDDHKFGMEWGTVIEVEEGDVVYFGKMASYGAAVLSDDKGSYYLIHYSELILKLSGEELYPLNGYVVVTKEDDVVKSKLIIVPSKKHNKRLGVVKYIGRPNTHYFPKSKKIQEITGISEGDRVMFGIAGWTELEDPRYAKLDKNIGYIHRRWIVAQLV